MNIEIRARFNAAPTFSEYLETVEKNADLWVGVHERVRLPESLLEIAAKLPGKWHLLALSEDWCGDAVNLLPIVARWADSLDNVDLRVLSRDENLDIMDAHLTDGRARSIPIVIFYNEEFEELGWWGPRPKELQEWVTSAGMELDSADRYKHIRRWYARDKGATTLAEIVDHIVAAA